MKTADFRVEQVMGMEENKGNWETGEEEKVEVGLVIRPNIIAQTVFVEGTHTLSYLLV